MPPKKEEKKAKPAAAKIVADKVKICPHLWPETRANASSLDLWHEECEQATPNLLSYSAYATLDAL